MGVRVWLEASGLQEWLAGRSFVLETAAIALVLLLFAQYGLPAIRRVWRQYVAFRTVPTDPDQHFLLGHSPRMLRDRSTMVDWFTGLYAQHKWKSFKVVLGPFWYKLMCVHPDTVKVVLKSDPKSGTYNVFKPWLGEGLLIASGAQWARSRKLLTPAFHFDVLKPYVQVFTDTANTLVGEWSKVPEGKSINVFPHISLLTLDVMLRCTCSYQSNCQTNKTPDPYIKAVFDLSILGVKRNLFLPATYDLVYACTPDGWRNRRACNIVHGMSLRRDARPWKR